MRLTARPAITTTLYDLINTLHTHVGVEDDRLVTAIVTYLLRTGQIRCIETLPTDHGWIGHHEDGYLNDAFGFPAHQKFEPPTSSTNLWQHTPVEAC